MLVSRRGMQGRSFNEEGKNEGDHVLSKNQRDFRGSLD